MLKVCKWLFIFLVLVFAMVFPVLVHSQKGSSVADQEFRERYIDGSDLICIGKVLSESVPAPANLLQVPFDPNWQMVTVEVSGAFVGNSKRSDRIQIIFPGTTSVMWAGPPKLVLGGEYVFILQDLTSYRYLPNKPEQVKKGQYYLVMSPERVQPKTRANFIQAMIH